MKTRLVTCFYLHKLSIPFKILFMLICLSSYETLKFISKLTNTRWRSTIQTIRILIYLCFMVFVNFWINFKVSGTMNQILTKSDMLHQIQKGSLHLSHKLNIKKPKSIIKVKKKYHNDKIIKTILSTHFAKWK